MQTVSCRAMYPDQPLFRTHDIVVPGGHRLHVREWGRADGIPAVVLHGGPGSGSSPLLWRTFDPARYRVIAPDQRGAGLSTPRGSVAANTTADLLADLRHLRSTLGIARWLVVGGSWGATLALAHALDDPGAVAGLLLRASFVARAADIAHFFDRAPAGLEDVWQAFRQAAAPLPWQTLLGALHARLLGADAAAADAVALAWWRWEQALQRGEAVSDTPPAAEHARQVHRLRVQAHYLVHACWLDAPGLPERAAALPAGIPVLLVHGRQDHICPPAGATQLHAALPGSRLQWIAGAGHDPTHPAMVDAMVGALDAWAAQGAWPREVAA